LLVNARKFLPLAAGAFLAVLMLGTAAGAQHASAAPSSTVNLQGNDGKAWAADPHMHAFYDAAVAAFANGPDKVDVDAFEAKSFAIFRAFGAARGVGAAAMQDHLKLVPRQIVSIVREDPKVLDSYENFTVAMMGPD
jgi:hypothetical protein